jgi:hypothetical protein
MDAMEILGGPEITDLINRRYARNPNGWSYTVSPARSNGFYDVVVAGEDESFQLKMDTLFKPNPLVLGSRSAIDLRRYSVSVPLSFGYREVDPVVARDLGAGVRNRSLVDLLSSIAPVVPEVGRAYAHGPFVLTRAPRPALDEVQARLEERLTSDMLKLVTNRYPSYG